MSVLTLKCKGKAFAQAFTVQHNERIPIPENCGFGPNPTLLPVNSHHLVQ